FLIGVLLLILSHDFILHFKTTTDNQHNIIHFDEKSISPTANKEQQQKHENNKVSKQCVHNETERGVTSLPDEYRHVIDALLDRPTIA
ncbi:unnamed protein product, partial [Rotaria magnacalcarata]